jgi:ATP-binding cassette subfamily F protein 3
MMFSGDTAKKKIGVLSGGEKSRVLLGKILAKPCNLLLLDEPTHHLDVESIEALIDALEDFEGAVVIVTHSELILKRLELTQIVVCHVGRQSLFNGHYEEFLEKVGWEEERAGSKEKNQQAEKLERKRKHEELMAAKAKMRPLENALRKVEKTIQLLEEELKKEHAEILLASSAEADILLASIEKKEKELEANFEKFLNLSEEIKRLESSN